MSHKSSLVLGGSLRAKAVPLYPAIKEKAPDPKIEGFRVLKVATTRIKIQCKLA